MPMTCWSPSTTGTALMRLSSNMRAHSSTGIVMGTAMGLGVITWPASMMGLLIGKGEAVSSLAMVRGSIDLRLRRGRCRGERGGEALHGFGDRLAMRRVDEAGAAFERS